MQKILLKYIALLAFFCILFTNFSSAELDSIRIIKLKEKIAKERSDKIKLDYVLELSQLLVDEVNSGATSYAKDAINLARAIDNFDKEIEGLIILSRYYNKIGDIQESTKNATKALDLNENFKSDLRYSQIYLQIADNYRTAQAIKESFKYYSLALKYAKLSKDKSILAEVYSRLGVYYFENTSVEYQQRKDSIEFYINQSLKLSKENKDIDLIVKNYNNLGLYERYTNLNIQKAEEYYLKSYNLAVQYSKMTVLANICYNLGSINIYKKDYKTAKKYIDQGFEIVKKYRMSELNIIYLRLFSNYYSAVKDFQEAYQYINQYQQLNTENLQKKMGFRSNQALVNLQNRNQLNEQRLQTETKQLQLTIALLATAFFSLLAITFYIRNKNSRSNNAKLEAKNNEIKLINEALDKSHRIVKEQNNLLEESNSAKDKLFSIISHDLKNPIGALKELIQILANERKDLTDEEIDEILTELKLSSSNVLDLLLELLTWSRSQQGKISYDPHLQDLYQLVYQNISILQPLAKQKNINLINQVNENTLAYIDANMVNTIIRNLINNAIKFTNIGGSIIIGAGVSTNELNELIVYVKDTGVGIPKDKIDNLFQIQSTYTTKGTSGEKGTGLGLLIVKDFVEKNNGKIWVESELNVGTTFYFTLKISKE